MDREAARREGGDISVDPLKVLFDVLDLSIELVGTCESVAARMGEVMQEVGGDGFLISMPNVNRRTLAEIEDGLAPALQDRGLVRKAYEHKQFRDNLLEF